MNPSRRAILRVLIPLGLGTALSLAGDLTLYAVLPAYAAATAFSMATIGLLLSANRLVRLISNPLVGLLLAGARRRGFLLTGFGMGALSTLLYILAQGSSAIFLAGRLMWGISWSIIYIGGYVAMMDVASEQERGWASGVVQSFVFAGMAINPLLGGLLSDRFGFTTALWACTALSAVGFFIVLISLPETLALPAGQGLSTRSMLRGALDSFRHNLSTITALAHPRSAAISYVYFAANFVGEGVLLSTLGLYLQNRYGSQVQLSGAAGWVIPVATASGLLLGLRSGISTLVAPLAGSLSDRAGSRWGSAVGGILINAAGLLVITSFSTPWALLAGVVLAATGAAVLLTVIPPLAREINPGAESATVLGLLANTADLGMALGPLITYALLDLLPLDMVYRLAMLALTVGLLPIWLAHRRP